MKTAVVLFNLGGPDRTESIRPYLFNFFMDKNIIGAPKPLRLLIAWWISRTRGKGAALQAYARLGGKSPLLENTQLQREALERELRARGIDAKVFVSMRYWHPMAKDVVKEVSACNPDQIILLPLYPQFSTTTVFSSFQDWERQVGRGTKVCCWPFNAGFIAASADLIKTEMQKAPVNTRLLFSAHGLPEKVVKGGDPYQWQCEESARRIASAAGVEDWQICYQSRVGPLKWIGPSTEEALHQAARDGKGVVIYPHAFVSEHVETLVEIEEEYRHKAAQLGVPYFARVSTVMTHPLFIAGLADIVQSKLRGEAGARLCPASFARCLCLGEKRKD